MFSASLFVLLAGNVFAQEGLSKMPKLSTKQDVTNLRFLSQDGKFTYYQRRSGALIFSTNFSVQDAIVESVGTYYDIVSTPARKYLAVKAQENKFRFLDIVSRSKIYALEYGTHKSIFLGLGDAPQLHLGDTWISFYEKYKRELWFINITNTVLKFKIKLPKKKNPYFLPSAVMLNDQTILYVDQNEKGMDGLIRFDRSTGKKTVLHKQEDPFQRLEICEGPQSLFLGIFDLHSYNRGSRILSSKKTSLKFTPIYSSEFSDLGGIVCNTEDQKIYFIKAFENGSTELARLDPQKKGDGRITVLSDLKTVTQFISMDGKLIVPFRGEFYVPIGGNDYIKTERLGEK